MKTLLINTRILAVAFVSAFAVAFTTPAVAAEPTPVELKYLGQLKNQPLFELTFNNGEDTEFTVVIRDEFKNVLYKEFIKSGVTSKKYLLNTDELGDVSLQFEITGKKSDKTIIYEVNRNSRYVENLVVNKIK
jgi:hypothetical protein